MGQIVTVWKYPCKSLETLHFPFLAWTPHFSVAGRLFFQGRNQEPDSQTLQIPWDPCTLWNPLRTYCHPTSVLGSITMLLGTLLANTCPGTPQFTQLRQNRGDFTGRLIQLLVVPLRPQTSPPHFQLSHNEQILWTCRVLCRGGWERGEDFHRDSNLFLSTHTQRRSGCRSLGMICACIIVGFYFYKDKSPV